PPHGPRQQERHIRRHNPHRLPGRSVRRLPHHHRRDRGRGIPVGERHGNGGVTALTTETPRSQRTSVSSVPLWSIHKTRIPRLVHVTNRVEPEQTTSQQGEHRVYIHNRHPGRTHLQQRRREGEGSHRLRRSPRKVERSVEDRRRRPDERGRLHAHGR